MSVPETTLPKQPTRGTVRSSTLRIQYPVPTVQGVFIQLDSLRQRAESVTGSAAWLKTSGQISPEMPAEILHPLLAAIGEAHGLLGLAQERLSDARLLCRSYEPAREAEAEQR
jgi:hypothetical protein